MTPAFGVDPNPIADSANWYQGHNINKNWYYAPDAWYGGYFTAPGGGVNGWSVRKGHSAQGGVANPSVITDSSIDPNTILESEDNEQISIDQLIENIESLPLPSTDFWHGKNSTGVNVVYADYISGDRCIFDADAGSVDYWSTDANFQAYYSKYWQDGSSWFHGTTAYSKPRAKTKHGAVIASTQHSSLPSFMIGLNENGAGTSKGGRIFFGDSSDRSSITGTYGTGGGGKLSFKTDTTGGTSQDRLVIDSDGSIRFNNAFTFPTSIGSAGQVLKVPSTGTTLLWADDAGGGSATVVTDTDGDTKIQVEESADEDILRFDTAASQRMVILANGNVGINNTTPIAKLTVTQPT